MFRFYEDLTGMEKWNRPMSCARVDRLSGEPERSVCLGSLWSQQFVFFPGIGKGPWNETSRVRGEEMV